VPVEGALAAARTAGEADVATVQDHRDGEGNPGLPRHQGHEIALDPDRVVVPRQPQSPRDAGDVGVDDDA